MFLLQNLYFVGTILALFLHVLACNGAPDPRSLVFLTDQESDMETTTEFPLPESVTSGEYIVLENDIEDAIAQPSETNDIVASASSQSSSSSTSNALSGNNGATTGGLSATHQANLLLLQQLQQQLQRQQQLKQPQQQQSQNQRQQFSLDGLVKSVMKMLFVAKTKIDQGARTFRDILQLFDRKKYVNIILQNQASETNFITT